MKINKHLNFWNMVSLASLVLIFLFLIYPSFSLVSESFISSTTGRVTLENYVDFFSLPYYFNALKHSLAVCFAATLFATLIGVPVAYFMSRTNIYFKGFLDLIIMISLLSPPFIGAYSWILLLGRNGWITNLLSPLGIVMPTIYGFTGIVIVFTLKFFPYVYIYTSGALNSIDASLEEAAENLGMNRLQRLFTVTFPLVMPSITAGALMVFMTSLADFGTPMLIGEGYKVLPVMIYDEFMSEMGGDATVASTISVVVVACSTIVLFLQKYLISRKSYKMNALRPPKETALKGNRRVLATLFVGVISFIAFLPQLVVIYTSFLKTNGPLFVSGFSLDSYYDIMNKLSSNIYNTFLYSIISIVVMLLMGLILSYIIFKRKNRLAPILDILIMFPYVIPGSVLGIGLLVCFNKRPLLLSGTGFILIVSYVIRKLAYTVRSGTAILHQIDPSIEEASINLGVSPMKTFFKVTAIMMGPGIFSGLILSWISTINELSSTIILYTGRTGTIAVAIYTEVIRDSFGSAAALSTILTVMSVLSLLVFKFLSRGKKVNI
ncbi:iron ABC transporter permease [Propionigenium maris DSM 9537]|uniref:Iron ABC transporter permease n=1 Tax=Propionigenium maris DSM 9537 TaxID=1123000 RepID=A0A9W6GJF3_9FUSO|nr:iron ABC transporter permease [Propionigenium maris]GLI56273.1 iron ABC transporter permease [Propionigenium maris DSM 9537]